MAHAIEESVWEDVVGTVNGDNSVLILTANFFFQRLVYERLKYYLSDGGQNELLFETLGRIAAAAVVRIAVGFIDN